MAEKQRTNTSRAATSFIDSNIQQTNRVEARAQSASLRRSMRFKRKPRRTSALAITERVVSYLETPLLRAPYPITDVRCLPFVSEQATADGRCFWHLPPSEGYTNDCSRGELFGAAYLLYRQSNPGDAAGLLGWIATAMAASDEASAGFAVGFWHGADAWLSSAARSRQASDFESQARKRISAIVARG